MCRREDLGMSERMWSVRVETGESVQVLEVVEGTTLREALLDAGLSPYGVLTRKANCGGRGLCATCGVWLEQGPEPVHWHDRAAARYGYPRLSCQVRVEGPMAVRLITDKVMWGKLLPSL